MGRSFQNRRPAAGGALERAEILAHPFVIGEIALGNLGDRARRLGPLATLPMAKMATISEVSRLIDAERLYGAGIGYVDVHLLASTLLTDGAKLWTRDRRLRSVSERLGVTAWMTQ